MEIIDKIVCFEKCKDCEFSELKEEEHPCDDCLENPVNTYTNTPLHFKKKIDKK